MPASLARFALAIVVALTVAGRFDSPVAEAQSRLATFPKGTVTIRSAGGESHEFRVELARTPRQQSQGLMFRRRLAPDAGMLFIYPRPVEASMWMKNTLIPLDMVFIRPGGTIGRIAERTVPMSETVISSGGKVIAVLELNAGTTSRLGIEPGDRVTSPAMPSVSD